MWCFWICFYLSVTQMLFKLISKHLYLKAWENFKYIWINLTKKTHQVHAVCVFVKSVVPKVPWSVFSSTHGCCVWKKFSLLLRGKSKLWRWIMLSCWDWSWTSAIINGPCVSGTSLMCLKSYRNAMWGLSYQVAWDNINNN